MILREIQIHGQNVLWLFLIAFFRVRFEFMIFRHFFFISLLYESDFEREVRIYDKSVF